MYRTFYIHCGIRCMVMTTFPSLITQIIHSTKLMYLDLFYSQDKMTILFKHARGNYPSTMFFYASHLQKINFFLQNHPVDVAVDEAVELAGDECGVNCIERQCDIFGCNCNNQLSDIFSGL